MFTNWLTGTSGTNNHNNFNNNISNNPNTSNNNNNICNNPSTHNLIENRSTATASLLASNSNLITNPAGHILMSTPPDVVLEVGPAPSTVRFVAHSIVLGMHSGYLRSAIRLDEHILAERNTATSSSSASSAAATSSPDFVLFLSNVTAEQFAPLLTYMYTGYLDLNIENIFGVLLATHVLHMPRALEICRAFLARAQTEGYLGARLAANSNLQQSSNQTATNLSNNNKIIRPIPSKATMPHFGFLPTTATNLTMAPPPPTPQQQQQQQQLVNFKQLQRHTENFYQAQQPQQPLTMENENAIEIKQNERAKSEEIDVDQESMKASSEIDDDKSDKGTIKVHSEENDEDEEVFIDSSDADNTDNDNGDDDEMEVIIEVKPKKMQQKQSKTAATSTPKSKEDKKHISKSERNNKKVEHTKKESNNGASSSNNRHQQQSKRRAQNKARSGLQIAKAPIPASQLDVNEGSSVIVDVASCDGPVRFRRILNTAYGHKPEDFAAQMPERSQQSVSYSFHQQMARTIHHQQQQQQQQRQHLQKQHALGEESENSESSGCGGAAGGGGGGGKHSSKHANQLNSNEIYVCVYCKHTFKSQYCYQKHAKRHLNPLSLSPAERCDKAAAALNAAPINLNFNGAQFGSGATGGGSGAGDSSGGGVGGMGVGCLPMPLLSTKQNTSDLLRREVRPLDMNVQYYPCKTCGSKFPSYYFVHKHRKLCHADEELNVVSVEKPKNGAAAVANGTSSDTSPSNTVEEPPKDQQSNAANFVLSKTNASASSVNSGSSSSSNTNNAIEEPPQVKHEHS